MDVNAPTDLPEFITLPDRKCGKCGSHSFLPIDRKPHISIQCADCHEVQPGWISRAELGIGKRNIRREPIDFDVRAAVLQRWNHRCAWCGVSGKDAMLHVGHILQRDPVEKIAGVEIADCPHNLAPSCETCNAGAHLIDQMAFDLILAGLRLASGRG